MCMYIHVQRHASVERIRSFIAAFAILFPNFHPTLLLVQMASHHGCLKPHLHLSPLLFATYLTFPFPLAWYPGLDWKSSFIVPVPKSSPPSDSPSNYRPISLLYLISKLLEKHIHSILSDFCMSCDLISPFQFGFLPQRPTASALLFSTHSILSLLESHVSVCGVFLDLKKAFNSVPHQPLLDLLSSFSLPPHLLNWIHSYLLNRSQSVVVCGSTSSSLLVSSGVPQGSILGPLLFLVYTSMALLTSPSLFPLTSLSMPMTYFFSALFPPNLTCAFSKLILTPFPLGFLPTFFSLTPQNLSI